MKMLSIESFDAQMLSNESFVVVWGNESFVVI